MNIKSKTREKETMKAGSRGLYWVEVMDDSDAPEVRKLENGAYKKNTIRGRADTKGA